MWKLGISTCEYTDRAISDYLPRIKKAGYDAIDLSLYSYTDEIMGPNRMSWEAGIRSAAENNGLIIGQAHAKMGNVANLKQPYKPPTEIYYRSIEVCGAIGCKNLVIHPLVAKAVIDENKYEELLDYNVRWFKELTGHAKAHRVHICIENAVDIRPHTIVTPFTVASDVIALVERIGDPCIGICLDTGHAHIASQDIADMIRQFSKYLRVLHLHDNFGMVMSIHPDRHLFPGAGTIDFPSVFRTLKEINFAGVINLEIGNIERLPVDVRDAAITGGALVAQAYIDGLD